MMLTTKLENNRYSKAHLNGDVIDIGIKQMKSKWDPLMAAYKKAKSDWVDAKYSDDVAKAKKARAEVLKMSELLNKMNAEYKQKTGDHFTDPSMYMPIKMESDEAVPGFGKKKNAQLPEDKWVEFGKYSNGYKIMLGKKGDAYAYQVWQQGIGHVVNSGLKFKSQDDALKAAKVYIDHAEKEIKGAVSDANKALKEPGKSEAYYKTMATKVKSNSASAKQNDGDLQQLISFLKSELSTSKYWSKPKGDSAESDWESYGKQVIQDSMPEIKMGKTPVSEVTSAVKDLYVKMWKAKK